MSPYRFAGLSLLLLASCVTPSAMQLKPGQAIPPGEAAVFGRVEVWDGRDQVIGRSRGERGPAQAWTGFFVALSREPGGEAISQCLSDGAIRWHLPPGRYAIHGYARLSGPSRLAGRIGATFEVPEGASAVYIGYLGIQFPQLRMILADRHEEESEAARPVLPEGARPVVSLLRLPEDDAVPFDPSLTGTTKPVPWREVKGVTPASNELVDTLQPTLAWENPPGVDTAGLTYDLRVWRVILIGDAWAKGVHESWGPLVYSREGLAGTSHRLEASLRPGTEYYWEVRLRRGDRVGPWSRYDSRVELIVYSSRKRNMPFKIRTPEEADLRH